jgi:hypothetical protein
VYSVRDFADCELGTVQGNERRGFLIECWGLVGPCVSEVVDTGASLVRHSGDLGDCGRSKCARKPGGAMVRASDTGAGDLERILMFRPKRVSQSALDGALFTTCSLIGISALDPLLLCGSARIMNIEKVVPLP